MGQQALLVEQKVSHLTRTPGDMKTMCGLGDRRGPACPHIWVRWLETHCLNYGLVPCPDCELVLNAGRWGA